MKRLNIFFKYIENLWLGRDGKPSLRSSLAIALSINLMMNISHAVYKWDTGQSLADLALLLGIEAGLIAALLGLKAYTNIQETKMRGQNGDSTLQNGPQD